MTKLETTTIASYIKFKNLKFLQNTWKKTSTVKKWIKADTKINDHPLLVKNSLVGWTIGGGLITSISLWKDPTYKFLTFQTPSEKQDEEIVEDVIDDSMENDGEGTGLVVELPLTLQGYRHSVYLFTKYKSFVELDLFYFKSF